MAENNQMEESDELFADSLENIRTKAASIRGLPLMSNDKLEEICKRAWFLYKKRKQRK